MDGNRVCEWIIDFPAQTATGLGYTTFDIIASVTLITMALLSKRLVPSHGKRWMIPITGLLMVGLTSLNFLSLYVPSYVGIVGLPAVICGGVGIAFIILLWLELFGCPNPLRIGLHYSGGIVARSLILWLFKGLLLPWLWACTCLVPIVSQPPGNQVHELANRFGLIQLEEDILLLLAQQKRPAEIERELFVANSTVKTHVKHIYQKLDAHSHTDSYQLLGIAAN